MNNSFRFRKISSLDDALPLSLCIFCFFYFFCFYFFSPFCLATSSSLILRKNSSLQSSSEEINQGFIILLKEVIPKQFPPFSFSFSMRSVMKSFNKLTRKKFVLFWFPILGRLRGHSFLEKKVLGFLLLICLLPFHHFYALYTSYHDSFHFYHASFFAHGFSYPSFLYPNNRNPHPHARPHVENLSSSCPPNLCQSIP